MPAESAHIRRSDLQQKAVHLLDQQCWCWGQDVQRPHGNWLVKKEFERIPAPAERRKCPSIYRKRLANGGQLILRGFGLLFALPGSGTVFLCRDRFIAGFTHRDVTDCLPWSTLDLPAFDPIGSDNLASGQVVAGVAAEWIAEYERNIVAELGLDYRRQCLANWEYGKRRWVPAEELASQWDDLARLLDPTSEP